MVSILTGHDWKKHIKSEDVLVMLKTLGQDVPLVSASDLDSHISMASPLKVFYAHFRRQVASMFIQDQMDGSLVNQLSDQTDQLTEMCKLLGARITLSFRDFIENVDLFQLSDEPYCKLGKT